MALTPERIKELWDAYRAALPRYLCFAKAVEAEVRKQDDALIRNFVAAIKLDRHDWEDWPEDSRKSFEALRARLRDYRLPE